MFKKIFSSRKPPTKPVADAVDADMLAKRLDEIQRKQDEIANVLDVLKIPHTKTLSQGCYIEGSDLIKILSDEKQLKVIMTKMRNKAFW
jgi:hypothetical protein